MQDINQDIKRLRRKQIQCTAAFCILDRMRIAELEMNLILDKRGDRIQGQ